MITSIFNKGQKPTAKITVDELSSLRGQVEAINKSQGVIEFNLDGTVIQANENFLVRHPISD